MSEMIIGPKILLEGASGTGKTHALGSLVDWASKHDFRVFVLFTENGNETLSGYWRDRGQEPPENLFWHQTLTKPVSLKSLIDAADKVGKLTYESLTKLQDSTRGQNNAFHAILTAMADFRDDRTGKSFGAVDALGVRDIFVIDSLSELANACMKMVIGNKPTASQPDYGVAQNNLMNFLRLCTQGIVCPFVMTAHVDRQTDEITQSVKIMTKAIGKALAGDIPQLFSDVIYTVRDGTTFYWDTAHPSVDLKTRNLKIAQKQLPDFGPLMDSWARKTGILK